MRACLTWPVPNFEQEHYHLQYINALRVLWVVFRSQQVVKCLQSLINKPLHP